MMMFESNLFGIKLPLGDSKIRVHCKTFFQEPWFFGGKFGIHPLDDMATFRLGPRTISQ